LLDIVTVVDLSRLDVFDGFYLTDEQLTKIKEKLSEQTLDKALDRVKKEAPDLRARTTLLEGDTTEVLLEQCAQADIAVLGRSGKNGAERWLMGSMPSRIIERAKCPVVVIP